MSGRYTVHTEIPRRAYQTNKRAVKMAWGALEEEAEDMSMRVILRSRRVIDKGPVIRLECEITHCG